MVPLSSSLGLNCSDREHVGLWRRTEAMAYLPVYLAHGGWGWGCWGDVVFSVFCLPVVGYHLRLSTQPFSDFVSTLCTCFTYSTFKDKNKNKIIN